MAGDSRQPRAWNPLPAPNNRAIMDALESSAQNITHLQKTGKFLLYGKSGHGKTVLAARIAQAICPEGKSIAYVDSAEGWVSIDNHPKIADNITRFAYKGFSQLEVLAEAISSNARGFGKFGVVILDEFTSMSDRDLAIITRHRATQDTTKDPDTPAWPDMNTEIRRVSNVMEAFYSKDIHLILVGHVREDKDGVTQIVTKSPNFLPSAQGKVKEPLHLVAYVEASQQETGGGAARYVRTVQVHPSVRVDAKCRIPNLNVKVTDDQIVEACHLYVTKQVPEVEAITEPVQDVFDPGVEITE